jgi:hypothetical protein
MWRLLLIAYLVMAFFVGSSRSRCGEETDQIGLHRISHAHDVLYGSIWPVTMVIYWGQHGSLGGFFSRAERVNCT